MSLKTDYKDDILATGNLRKYQMINNSDGTVSFQDVTVYEQTGDIFGAGDINKTNQAVNEKFDSDDVVDPMETTEHGFAADALAVKNQFNEQNKNMGGLRFGKDGDGNYGYYGADDSLIPFNSIVNSKVFFDVADKDGILTVKENMKNCTVVLLYSYVSVETVNLKIDNNVVDLESNGSYLNDSGDYEQWSIFRVAEIKAGSVLRFSNIDMWHKTVLCFYK